MYMKAQYRVIDTILINRPVLAAITVL